MALPSRKPDAKHPELVWVQRERFMGWACSGCAWEFIPAVWPAGDSIDEMKQNYERMRDKEFESHICAAHPKRKS